MTVNLSEVAQEMMIGNHDVHVYLNRHTGATIPLTAEILSLAEETDDLTQLEDWEQEMVREALEVLESDAFLQLPSQFEIHEYRIMEDFCTSLADETLSRELLYQIRGAGAFRRFKDAIYQHDIQESWYRFQQAALEEIAAAWLDEHQIAYTREKKIVQE